MKTNQLILYISAANDLDEERELLGRAVAEIPIDIGWRIAQSPRRNEPVDLAVVAEADIHLLLLGGDIRAPIGLEWLMALRARRSPYLFLKQKAPRTQAAQDFIRFTNAKSRWQPFNEPAELRLEVLKLLAKTIELQAIRLALTQGEMARLKVWRAELESAPPEIEDSARGGAGESSIILTRERFFPSSGILLGTAQEETGDEGPK